MSNNIFCLEADAVDQAPRPLFDKCGKRGTLYHKIFEERELRKNIGT